MKEDKLNMKDPLNKNFLGTEPLDARNLPKNWQVANLEQVVDILDSKRVPVNAKVREERAGSIPYYGATGQVGWIDDYLFDEELILLGEDGAPFLDPNKPKAYIIRGRSWVNNHAHVLRALDGMPSAYIKYYLDTFGYREFVTGTTRLKLNQAAMRRIPVPLAPPGEQKRIVEEINKQFSRLDEAVVSLKRAKANLTRYKAAVLKAAVEGKLTEQWRKEHPGVEPASNLLERILTERRKKWESAELAKMKAGGRGSKGEKWKKSYKEPKGPDIEDLPSIPVNWTWATLPQLGELNRGKSKHRPRNEPKLYGGPYPFIQTGDIRHSNGVITKYTQTYSEVGLKQSRLWPKRTLCITIAANIADTAILGFNACFPDSVVGFIPESEYTDVRFTEYFFRTAKKNIEKFAPATAQKNINLDILGKVAIPLPPEKEQQVIIEEIERRLSVAEEIERGIETNMTRTEHFRQSILKKAFAGELVTREISELVDKHTVTYGVMR
jgi:type I restriction enzyme S subunit